MAGLAKFLFYLRPEYLKSSISQSLSVDEYGRRAFHPQPGGLGYFFINYFLDLGIFKVNLEPFRIHTEYDGNVPDLLVAQLIVILEQKIVELPKLSLPVSRDNRSRCLPGILVAFERKIFMNNFDVFRVLLEHLLEYR